LFYKNINSLYCALKTQIHKVIILSYKKYELSILLNIKIKL